MSPSAPEEEAPRPTEGDEGEEAQASPEAAPTSDDAAAEAPPARRKRKKKRAAAASEEAVEDEAARDEAPAQRAGVPAFALDFPEDPRCTRSLRPSSRATTPASAAKRPRS